jgi:hypothetical protein
MDIIKLKIRVVVLAVVWVALVPIIATAHGGEVHVIGTVTKISETAVTVKTTAEKIVEVGFDEKTSYMRAKQPILRSSINAGDRIVIHALKVKEKLVAHTVEIGVPGAVQAASH